MDAKTAAGIREILQQFSAVCGRMDAAGALAFFADEGNVTLVGSGADEMARGREQLRDFLQHVLADAGGISWEWDDMIIDGTGSAAWVLAEGNVHVGSGTDTPRIPYRLSLVLENTDTGWKFRLFHGAEPK